jgi:hypothetical protein
MFAVEAGALETLVNKSDVVEWQTAIGDFDVFRLSPSASLGLFGREALQLRANLNAIARGSTKKYEVGSSTIPPRVARESLLSIDRHLGSGDCPRDFVL